MELYFLHVAGLAQLAIELKPIRMSFIGLCLKSSLIYSYIVFFCSMYLNFVYPEKPFRGRSHLLSGLALSSLSVTL